MLMVMIAGGSINNDEDEKMNEINDDHDDHENDDNNGRLIVTPEEI
jgi:hypothetical protein